MKKYLFILFAVCFLFVSIQMALSWARWFSCKLDVIVSPIQGEEKISVDADVIADNPVDYPKIPYNKMLFELCQRADGVYQKMGWGKSPCVKIPWTYHQRSEEGWPLIYVDFNSERSSEKPLGRNVTLILGGVHGDEKTPIHFVFRIANFLQEFPQYFKNQRVIVAPLVNPDGFFASPQKRNNHNGVDLNRNFPTAQWDKFAYRDWAKQKKPDPRKYPGPFPNSEQGTRFQIDLISKFHPQKIISVHSPLAFLDIDFENKKLVQRGRLLPIEKKAKRIAQIISEASGNYTLRDFRVYAGSLGNYAGNERSIPTVTLELSSANAKLVNIFWSRFSRGIFRAIRYRFPEEQVISWD